MTTNPDPTQALRPASGRRPSRDARPDAPEQPETLIDLLLTDAERPPRIEGVVVGTLVGVDGDGAPLVDFALNPDAAPLPARATMALDEASTGHEAALLFEQGDPRRPIVIGLMWEPERVAVRSNGVDDAADAQASVDGERLVFTAEREIVLQCGRASLTLTRAGKVLIRGEYVLSRSSGVNRIQGGSVQIN